MTQGSSIASGGWPRDRRGPSSPATAAPTRLLRLRIGAIRSGVLRTLVVTSSGTIVIGRPLSNTIAAACGSAWMLNSAAGVTLPRQCDAPPISTSPAMPAVISGALKRAGGVLVKGANRERGEAPGFAVGRGSVQHQKP